MASTPARQNRKTVISHLQAMSPKMWKLLVSFRSPPSRRHRLWVQMRLAVAATDPGEITGLSSGSQHRILFENSHFGHVGLVVAPSKVGFLILHVGCRDDVARACRSNGGRCGATEEGGFPPPLT